MSDDVKPATDEEVEKYVLFYDGSASAAAFIVQSLIARIRADAARIAMLEARLDDYREDWDHD